jgi:DNA-binding CsgD family transcriptional regulator
MKFDRCNLKAETGRRRLKKVRVIPKLITHSRKREANPSSYFVFCEKSSGVAQFRAAAGDDLNYTIERMASLLAMQCLVRGTEPSDFAVLVPAEKTLASRLASRAKELLEEGRAAAAPASLSPRQKEILQSVLCNRANKEIASKLNITVRTVKFHISCLLSKFGVDNRAELARRAESFLRSTVAASETLEIPEPALDSRHRDYRPIPLDTTLHVASRSNGSRYSPRTMLA